MNRFKAAGLHLILSFFIVTLVVNAMYFLWFPKAYFELMGAKKLVYLIGFVDIFLGPLLTLAIFKLGKRGLKFDLFCIGLVQVAALSYGVYVMLQARPIFTVFNKDLFQVGAVIDIVPEELAKAKNPLWRQPSSTGPQLVAIGEPDKKDKKAVAFSMTVSDYAVRYPKLYDDYNKHRDEVIKAGKPLATLVSDSAKNKSAVAKFINKSHRPESDFLVLPIVSLTGEMSAIVDAKTGDFIEIIDAKPKILPRKK
ncbi:MAG: hypothetical protein ABIP37_04240 [Methylotenera sp.]